MARMTRAAALLIVLVGTVHLNAQGVLVGEHHCLRAGYQLARVFDGEQVQGDLDAFYIGVERGITLGAGILSLHTGLAYQQNGHWQDADDFRRIHYLGMPVGLRVKLGPVFGQAGLNGLFRIGESYTVNGQNALTDATKSDFFDLAVHFGAGVRIAVVVLEARYHDGLTTGNNGNTNNYWQIGAGLLF